MGTTGNPLGGPPTGNNSQTPGEAQETANVAGKVNDTLTALADGFSKLAFAQTLVTKEMINLSDGVDGMTKKLGEAVDGMKRFFDTTEKVKKGVGDVKREVEGVKKEVGGSNSSAEKLVDTIEAGRKGMKTLSTVADEFNRKVKNGTATVEDAKKTYEKILSIYKKMLETTKKNSEQWFAIQRTMMGFEDTLKHITIEFGKGNSKLKGQAKLIETMARDFKSMELSSAKASGAFNNLGLGKMSKAILDLNNALGRFGRMEQGVRRGERFLNTKEEIRARRKESGVSPRRTIEDVKGGFKKANRLKEGSLAEPGSWGMTGTDFFKNHRARDGSLTGIDKKDIFDKEGNLDISKLTGKSGKKARDAVADFYFNPETGGQTGLAGVFNKYRAKSAMAAGDSTALSESLEGGGAMEGGLGLLSKATPYLAIGGMVGGAVKDLIDKVAKQNQETEKNLGKGGIFTTGLGGGEALKNVRQNLMAWGLNAHNITTERQMAVAQTMQEEGAGLSELARPSKGFLGNPRSVGDVGDIVFKQAREVGLTDVEGTKQVMKMLQTYKMTLTGTQDFFRTIGKDILAAGISTTKYLQLIDDVTNQFDSMNKSIETTTSLLRMLGSTGTATYDQMKEDALALTQDKSSLEQRAALFSLQTPEEKATFIKSQNEAAKTASANLASGINTAAEHLGMDKGALWKGLDPTSGTDIEKAYTRLKINKPENADAGVFTTPLEGYLRKYQSASGRAMVAQRGDAVETAAMMDIFGRTDEGNMNLNYSRLNTALGQQNTSFGQAIANPEQAGAKNPVILSGLIGAFGGDAARVMNLLNDAGEAIETEVRGMKAGKLSTALNPEDEESFYEKILSKSGTAFEPGKGKELVTKGMSQEDLDKFTENLKENTTTSDALDLLGGDSPIAKALGIGHKEDKTDQEKITSEIAWNTKTIDGALVEINGNIISWLGKPLQLLVDGLVGGGIVSDEEHNKQVEALKDKGLNEAIKTATALEELAEKKGIQYLTPEGKPLKDTLSDQKGLAAFIAAGDRGKNNFNKLNDLNATIRETIETANNAKQPLWHQYSIPKGEAKKQLDELGIAPGASGMLVDANTGMSIVKDDVPKVDQPAAGAAAKGVNGVHNLPLLPIPGIFTAPSVTNNNFGASFQSNFLNSQKSSGETNPNFLTPGSGGLVATPNTFTPRP